MLTVLEAINRSTEFLEKKNIESPRTNAEHLLAHVLKCKRLDLYLAFDRPLKENETDIYRELIVRRGKTEPLQYIVGTVEFYGLEFKVNPSVLIPRPETELLIEKILESVNKEDSLKILDIGTGSGNIAVSLAKNLSNSTLTAIDISEDAIEVAEENSELNNINGQISFYKIDFVNEQGFNESNFDLIVSNPPYVSINDYSELSPELKDHEPKIALTDNKDGLNFYSEISKKARTLLNKNGKLFFEVGMGQAEEVKTILIQNSFSDIEIFKDYSNIERVVKGVLT
jgi:release factor glutamine methyltransferase